MAYMNQERKSQLSPAIKAVLKKYGMKGSIAVDHHSTLVVNIKSGILDIDTGNYGYIQVNQYWIEENYSGEVRNFLLELKDAMMVGNYDRSDIQSDYFNVGWYISINIGQWNKPYVKL